MDALRERIYDVLEQKDSEIEALRQQLRGFGHAGAAAAAAAASSNGLLTSAGLRSAAASSGGGHHPGHSHHGHTQPPNQHQHTLSGGAGASLSAAAAGGGGGTAGASQAGWGSAYSSAAVSPSHPPGPSTSTLSGAWNAATAAAAAASTPVVLDRSGGLTSPAFSGKFTDKLLSGRSGSLTAGSPHATPGHSRNNSMVQQQSGVGLSPLSSGVRRSSSTGAIAVEQQQHPAAVAGLEGGSGLLAAGAGAAEASSSWGLLGQQEQQAEGSERLPLSTLHLSMDGTGTGGAGTPRGTSGGDGSFDEGPTSSPGLNLKGLAPEALKRRVQELDSQVREWKTGWEEADRQQRIMREEVARLESMSQITDRDALYLRSVIVSGFESGELPTSSTMFGVLGRLLHFSPQEMSRIKQHTSSKSAGTGISSLVLGAAAGGPPVGGGGIRL